MPWLLILSEYAFLPDVNKNSFSLENLELQRATHSNEDWSQLLSVRIHKRRAITVLLVGGELCGGQVQ